MQVTNASFFFLTLKLRQEEIFFKIIKIIEMFTV